MKTDIETIIDDLDLISNFVFDYSLGRNRGLTDEETKTRATKAFSKAIESLEQFKEAAEKDYRELYNVARCRIAKRNARGECEGYQRSFYDDEPADKCKECKEFVLYEKM